MSKKFADKPSFDYIATLGDMIKASPADNPFLAKYPRENCPFVLLESGANRYYNISKGSQFVRCDQ